ncbi:hypothetical protein TRFO_36297 [Tritrichomonas foetus]|uniref:Uncharacterized protein n=1 Tax=Tritrichomonas foetus TaxID=1144522 RepID=A0A1J4JFS0_9EUKA|nr:hypothetical protein TRFO_36297 [Tritrichomonas foetus]|eukprot:OHS97505.1 hypothetical protein TRFO_36297 [Tritrichomonas foetus]
MEMSDSSLSDIDLQEGLRQMGLLMDDSEKLAKETDQEPPFIKNKIKKNLEKEENQNTNKQSNKTTINSKIAKGSSILNNKTKNILENRGNNNNSQTKSKNQSINNFNNNNDISHPQNQHVDHENMKNKQTNDFGDFDFSLSSSHTEENANSTNKFNANTNKTPSKSGWDAVGFDDDLPPANKSIANNLQNKNDLQNKVKNNFIATDGKKDNTNDQSVLKTVVVKNNSSNILSNIDSMSIDDIESYESSDNDVSTPKKDEKTIVDSTKKSQNINIPATLSKDKTINEVNKGRADTKIQINENNRNKNESLKVKINISNKLNNHVENKVLNASQEDHKTGKENEINAQKVQLSLKPVDEDDDFDFNLPDDMSSRSLDSQGNPISQVPNLPNSNTDIPTSPQNQQSKNKNTEKEKLEIEKNKMDNTEIPTNKKDVISSLFEPKEENDDKNENMENILEKNDTQGNELEVKKEIEKPKIKKNESINHKIEKTKEKSKGGQKKSPTQKRKPIHIDVSKYLSQSNNENEESKSNQFQNEFTSNNNKSKKSTGILDSNINNENENPIEFYESESSNMHEIRQPDDFQLSQRYNLPSPRRGRGNNSNISNYNNNVFNLEERISDYFNLAIKKLIADFTTELSSLLKQTDSSGHMIREFVTDLKRTLREMIDFESNSPNDYSQANVFNSFSSEFRHIIKEIEKRSPASTERLLSSLSDCHLSIKSSKDLINTNCAPLYRELKQEIKDLSRKYNRKQSKNSLNSAFVYEKLYDLESRELNYQIELEIFDRKRESMDSSVIETPTYSEVNSSLSDFLKLYKEKTDFASGDSISQTTNTRNYRKLTSDLSEYRNDIKSLRQLQQLKIQQFCSASSFLMMQNSVIASKNAMTCTGFDNVTNFNNANITKNTYNRDRNSFTSNMTKEEYENEEMMNTLKLQVAEMNRKMEQDMNSTTALIEKINKKNRRHHHERNQKVTRLHKHIHSHSKYHL